MAKVEITKMNFEVMEDFGNKVFELGNLIDTSLGNIDNAFRHAAESNELAGSTLKAVTDALIPVLKIRSQIQLLGSHTYSAIQDSISEVRQSELENEANLTELLSMDPMSYEIPAEFNIDIGA